MRAGDAIEDASGGVPQDVEWAIARGLPFPDSVFFLQHRPETTWTAPAAGRRDAGAAETPRLRRSTPCSTRCATSSRCRGVNEGQHVTERQSL